MFCPITQTEIINAGMTVNGSIYEYDAIIKWLEKSNRDPITNIELASTFVRKININLDEEAIKTLVNDSKKTYWFWNPERDSTDYTDSFYQKKKSLKDNLNEENLKNNKNIIVNYFASNNYYSWYYNPNIVLPSIDYLDFQSCVFMYKNFKFVDFVFNNLENSIFKNCNLSSVRFIGCNMNNIIFINCKFRGDIGCFYKVSGEFTFKNCSMEYTNKWIVTTELTEMEKILKCRGLRNRNIKVVAKNLSIIVSNI